MSEDIRKRIYVREVASGEYNMEEHRKIQLSLDRVRPKDLNEHGESYVAPESAVTMAPWRLGPGEPEMLTQSIQVHFRHMIPGGKSGKHGHQNEAVFYVLEGSGYDIDDEIRYDYETGDTLLVHADSVHQHFNSSETDWLRIIVFKAKSLGLFLGLIEQGRDKFQSDELFEPREPWGTIWTPGVEQLDKVVVPSEDDWEYDAARIGKIRRIVDKDKTNQRMFTVDLFEQVVEPGAASIGHRHMADEVIYVLEGEGVAVQRDVRSEIDTRYYARVSKHAREWTFQAGDVVYVPQNSIHEFRNTGTTPLRFLSAQNRVFRHLGYDNIDAKVH